jgi:hypothetical protein
MRKLIASIIFGIILSLSFMGAIPAALADSHSGAPVSESGLLTPRPDFLPSPPNATKGGDTQNYILNTKIPQAINLGVGLMAIAAFIAVIVSAFLMLTAYGNEEKVNRAKTNLQYTMMGMLFIILGYAIVSVVVSFVLPTSPTPGAFLMPSTYAVDINDIDALFPDQTTLIEQHDEQGRVSLPSGDLVTEIVPAGIVNILYLISFLVVLAFSYGGALLVIGRGNEEEITKAKNIVLWSSVALGSLIMAYGVIYGLATINFSDDSTTNSDDIFNESVIDNFE